MKKLLNGLMTITMVFVFAVALTGCGKTENNNGGETTGGNDNQQEQGNNDNQNNADRYKDFGLTLDKVKPDGSIDIVVDTDSSRTYIVDFTMSDTITKEVGFAYFKKIYDLTASVSDGGTNYKQTGGSVISPEVSPMGAWESEHSAESPMNEWFYKYNGKLLKVTIMSGIGFDDTFSVSIGDYS